MPNYDEVVEVSAFTETQKLKKEIIEKKYFLDYFSIALTTCGGIGFMPLAPGTFGSLFGVLIYFFFAQIEFYFSTFFALQSLNDAQITAWIHAVNLILFLLFCILSIWASGRATRLFQNKDPQKVVVDEVIGQLIVFLFVPFNI
jgi:phosphatidylglycerophosphatase A